MTPLASVKSVADSVMVIADAVDENLALASRNLANVLIVEPRYADPLSLVFYKKVLVTKGAIEPVGGGTEEISKLAMADSVKYARLVKELNIKTN